MSAKYRLAAVVFASLLMASCAGGDEDWGSFRVVSEKKTVYERPSSTSAVAGELSFGAEARCSEKGLNNAITKGWLRVKSGKVSGFMEKGGIGEEGLFREMDNLFEEAKEAAAQATGETGRRVPLLLEPESGAHQIDMLKEPTKVDILGRVVAGESDKGGGRRQTWYKIRLANGRAGFILKRQLRLTPPPELNAYTQVRTPVSWQGLGENVDPESGASGWDYIVTYESVGQDIDTDFTRFELYTFDPATKQYGTALAKGGLDGILPVEVSDGEGGGKVIEIRHHPKGDKGRIATMSYSYPKPIKLLGEKTAADGGEQH